MPETPSLSPDSTIENASEEIVILTEAAAEKLRELFTDKTVQGVRLGVTGGGCAGLQYQMEPCHEVQGEDLIQEIAGIRFILHPMVVPYLKGITVDYSNALVDGGFKFINPNASSTCGCGTSFGV